MNKNQKNKPDEKQQEDIITEQIRESYQSGLIEPEMDTRASEKR